MAQSENTRVIFEKEKLQSLKKHYNDAINSKSEIFTFDGVEYLVSYAKYLIEYLEDNLK